MNLEELRPLFPTAELASPGPNPRSSAMTAAEIKQWATRFSPTHPLAEAQRKLLLSALLLWHDHLDASHSLSQDLHSPDGSFLHAVMHRREPDFWNSKYWWRRVGDHPAFALLGQEAAQIVPPAWRDRLVANGKWDPFAFVDLVEQGQQRELLERLQELEMKSFLATL